MLIPSRTAIRVALAKPNRGARLHALQMLARRARACGPDGASALAEILETIDRHKDVRERKGCPTRAEIAHAMRPRPDLVALGNAALIPGLQRAALRKLYSRALGSSTPRARLVILQIRELLGEWADEIEKELLDSAKRAERVRIRLE